MSSHLEDVVGDREAETAVKLAAALGAMLAGKPREIQGAALADLLATWLAGHAPEIRADVLRVQIETVEKLIPPNAKIIAAAHGLPASWYGGLSS